MRFFASIRKKYFLYLALLVSIMLLFTLFGERGLMHIFRLQEEQKKIQAENSRLEAENQKLTEQIDRLRQHPKEEVEKIARQEMGLVKKGELVYQFDR